MTRSLRVLLDGVIDYAGLFPPARLDMPAAVAEYKSLSADDSSSWIVGRFVCPAGRLLEMEEEAGEDAFEVCVTGQGIADIERIGELSKSFPAAFEAKLAIEEISVAQSRLGESELFVEVPVANVDEMIRAVGDAGAFAKIRTGGIEAAAFPSAEQVARFLCACAKERVPFKATAGLHHPFYHRNDEYGVMMHGFLNMILASAVAMNGGGVGDVVRVLEIQDAGEFSFSEDSASVGGSSFGFDELIAVRGFFLSFGSCSVMEPLEDLAGHALL